MDSVERTLSPLCSCRRSRPHDQPLCMGLAGRNKLRGDAPYLAHPRGVPEACGPPTGMTRTQESQLLLSTRTLAVDPGALARPSCGASALTRRSEITAGHRTRFWGGYILGSGNPCKPLFPGTCELWGAPVMFLQGPAESPKAPHRQGSCLKHTRY